MTPLTWSILAVVFTAFAGVLAWLGSKDRRYLFIGIAMVVIIPLLTKFGLPKVKVTPEVKDLYDFIEELPNDKVVLLTCDYDPGSMPELHPMTFAILEHLCRRDIKFAVMELWPAGIDMAKEALEEIARKDHGKKDRIDFAHLGYKTGAEVVIQSLGVSLKQTYPVDVDGVPIDQIPVLQGIEAVKDFALIINISAGTPGTKEWVQQAGSRYGVPIATGCTGVQAPQIYPYYPNQLLGLLGGMAAAAEYEQLVDPDEKNEKLLKATQGMEAQSFCHALILLFVVFGNIVYFYGQFKGRKAR